MNPLLKLVHYALYSDVELLSTSCPLSATPRAMTEIVHRVTTREIVALRLMLHKENHTTSAKLRAKVSSCGHFYLQWHCAQLYVTTISHFLPPGYPISKSIAAICFFRWRFSSKINLGLFFLETCLPRQQNAHSISAFVARNIAQFYSVCPCL